MQVHKSNPCLLYTSQKEEILKGQDDRIKDQINKLKEQDDRLKEQDQVIRELMKKIEQLENISAGRWLPPL